MSEWTTPQPTRRGGRGRGGRGRGRGRGGLRGPPEVVFASYELSDVQKKRIDVYIMQSAAMFLAQPPGILSRHILILTIVVAARTARHDSKKTE